jgi:predicted HicB family RNase H-like nuclease
MGGALTRYAVNDGEGHSLLGEKIIPMSRENAQIWAEEHMDGDAYEAAFSEVSEVGNYKEQMNLKVSPWLKAILWKMAEEKKKTLSATVEELLAKALNGRG